MTEMDLQEALHNLRLADTRNRSSTYAEQRNRIAAGHLPLRATMETTTRQSSRTTTTARQSQQPAAQASCWISDKYFYKIDRRLKVPATDHLRQPPVFLGTSRSEFLDWMDAMDSALVVTTFPTHSMGVLWVSDFLDGRAWALVEHRGHPTTRREYGNAFASVDDLLDYLCDYFTDAKHYRDPRENPTAFSNGTEQSSAIAFILDADRRSKIGSPTVGKSSRQQRTLAEEEERQLAQMPSGWCMWRGGLLECLPNMPRHAAIKFDPTGVIPEDLFVHDAADLRNYSYRNERMVSRAHPWDELLIYVDGSCLGQHITGGSSYRGAGCAVIWKPQPHATATSQDRGVSFPLETRGLFGEVHPLTSNRVELRAAIEALACRHWMGEGWLRLTIATDSAYVVGGATNWIANWLRRDWISSSGQPVANKDLWVKLLSQINLYAVQGCEVRFLKIPRAWNWAADAEAKKAANSGEGAERYSECVVVDCPI